VLAGILERDELAAAGQRYQVVKCSLPSATSHPQHIASAIVIDAEAVLYG
jgi:hypothetical protein